MEAVWETSPASAPSEWFETIWSTLPTDPTAAIESYERSWRPPQFDPEQGSPTSRASARARLPTRPLLEDGTPSTWADYVAALLQADAFWRERSLKGSRYTVLGDSFSWVHTIRAVGLIAQQASWDSFTDRERWALLGMVEQEGTWGLLGSMKGAGNAKQLFRGASSSSKQVLARLRTALTPLIKADGTEATINAAVECLGQMSKEQGISHGVATRIMACMRPDVAVSVNAGSAPQLAELTGLPASPISLSSPKNYRALLTWVARQPWYDSPKPTDAWEASLWGMRAALVDCFVYEPL